MEGHRRTVLVKAISGRPRKISAEAKAKDGQNGQRQPSDHLQRPARSSHCRWCHCASLNNSAHLAQRTAVWESDAEEAFSAHTPQPRSIEVCKSTFEQATFTFSHLADAFIQSDLQGCIHILHLW